jgi:hypothetical protein
VNSAHAIVAAIGLERHHQVIQHLRKRQRDHDEVHALRAQADESNYQANRPPSTNAAGHATQAEAMPLCIRMPTV